MMVLHRDEGREVMRNSIICNIAPSACLLKALTINYSLCMTWTTTKISQAIVDLGIERVRTLPSIAATHAYVSNVSCFDYIMQSLHRLLDWCIRIKAVALQDVDVIKLKTFQ